MSIVVLVFQVIQKRISAQPSFHQNWATYESGFGDLCGSFWWGNANIKAWTSTYVKLGITLTQFDGSSGSYTYDQFKLKDPYYTIDLGNTNGNGDFGELIM